MSLVVENNLVKPKSKGEQTKELILEAAIQVLATHGIKGTTHRAIASQANIQLSLTTYYFKDIQALIHQAFVLNSIHVTHDGGLAWKKAFEYIECYDKASLRKVATKEQICDVLAKMSAQYLVKQIIEQPTALSVEQLLFTEIQVTPALRDLAQQHRKLLMAPFIRLCCYFNKHDPHINADIMLTLFQQIEYRNLAIASAEIDKDEIKALTRRIIAWVIGLKK